jgi:hypothetical protein
VAAIIAAMAVGTWSLSCPAEERLSYDDFTAATRLVVMVESKDPGAIAFGAGIVVGRRDDSAFILTTERSVGGVEAGRGPMTREVEVTFRHAPLRKMTGRADVLPGQAGDLAVIQVDGIPADVTFPLHLLGGHGELVRGQRVYAVGYPMYELWGVTLEPGRVETVDAEITFQSNNVRRGYAGGPILDIRGRLCGVIVEDDRPPSYRAVRLESALRRLTAEGFSVGPPATKVITDVGRAKGLPPLPQPGGHAPSSTVAADKEPAWLSGQVSKLSNLPPVRRKSLLSIFGLGGEPNFKLEFVTADGAQIMREVKEGGGTDVPPIPAVTWRRGVSIRVVDAGLIKLDAITEAITLHLRDIVPGSRKELPIVWSASGDRPAADRGHVAFSIRGIPFDPDHSSGTDATIEGATSIEPGNTTTGSIDVNAGDATDHLLLRSHGGSCVAALWIHDARNISVAARLYRDQSPLTLAQLQQRSSWDPEQSLWLVDCNRTGEALVRIQATGTSGKTSYRTFVTVPGDREGFGAFFDHWLEDQARYNKEYYMQPTNDRDGLGRSVSAMRRHFGVAPDDVLRVLDRRMSQAPNAKLALLVLRHDLRTYNEALTHCCDDAGRVRSAVAVLLAELGEKVEEAELERALRLEEEDFVIHAVNVIKTQLDQEDASRLLRPLLDHRNNEIKREVRRALNEL